MKLEREPEFGHITQSDKPGHESFDYELSLDSNGIKSGKVVKETQNGNSQDFKGNKKDGGELGYLMNDGSGVQASKLDCFNMNEGVKSYKDYQDEGFVAPFAKSSSEIESLEKESDVYTDKSALECEMPELQVCYRDSNYSSIKDICVDEGVHSQDKLLFEHSADKKSLCTFVFPDQDLDKEISNVEMDIGVFSSNGLNSSAANTSSMDFVCKSKDLIPTVHRICDTEDKKRSALSHDTTFSEKIILTKEMEAVNPQSRSPVCEENEPQVQISIENASETTNLAVEKSDSKCDETLVIAAPGSVAEEPKTSCAANELLYSSKIDKRRITFNFDPSTPVVTTSKEGPPIGVSECLETENTSPVTNKATDSSAGTGIGGCDETLNPVEDRTCDTHTASEKTQDKSEIEECSQTRSSGSVESPKTSSVNSDEISEVRITSSQLQHVMAREDCPQSSSESGRHKTTGRSIGEDGLSDAQFVSSHFQFGESSFSSAGPLSGRINYSGPVPYSGSISIRSDSSTTSTRSFAFPVLPNEWNSSPVRMAKADGRHFRKGWRHGILCCRF